jgi:DNA invertase Pin-like site-specific DNA recombinase
VTSIGYGRVSTTDQHPAMQHDALTAAGCDPIFIDNGVSGMKASRPELDRCLAFLREGDCLMITKLDRLGRSVVNLVELVDKLNALGVDLVVLDQPGMDTRTSTGKMIFTVVAAMAQFERDLISERTREGLKAAKARGKLGGRKPSYTPGQAQTARMLHDQGEHSAEEIGAILGVSRATVYRMIKPAVGS